MKSLPFQKRTMAILSAIGSVLVIFIYVAMVSGPFAPVSVTLAAVENKSLAPELFGIGSVEARYTYKIGPTLAGRVKRLDVHVGDHVEAGQTLGEMDPVDIDDRIRAQDATRNRAAAQLGEAQARKDYAQAQALRYERLLEAGSTSEEVASTKRQELTAAQAGLTAAREELARINAERDALAAQRRNLRLIAPVDGLVVSRGADPGTTVVAGQAVVELIDPDTIWINVRFDQIRARGLAAGLPARITLRSQSGEARTGRVLRVEPLADAVTEETLAKVIFNKLPDPLPPVGELAEVTVELPPLPRGPVIPNAAIWRMNGELGVWRVMDGELSFTPVRPGVSDLEGHVLIREGLKAGDKVVIYSEKALTARSRIHVTSQSPGVAP